LTTAAANDGFASQETPAVPEAVGTNNNAPNEPKAPEPPVTTEAPTNETPVALALVPHAAEVCAAQVLDDDPASEISRLHEENVDAYGMSLERAIRIGELLTEQKDALEHGKFLPWVRASLPFSERTAQNYMGVFARRYELKSATVADLTTAYRLTAPRKAKPKDDKSKGSEGKGSTRENPKKADTEETQTKATDPSTTAKAEDDQKEQAHAENQPEEKPATTQAQQTEAAEQPTTTTATSTTAASADQQQDETTATTRPEQEQADTNAKADTDAARPAIKFKDALSVVMRVIAKNGPKLGRGVMTQIGSQEAITYWLRTPKPREDLSALDDHVADRLETLANKDLDDAKSWLEEHDKRLWAIIRERVPRQEGDDRADNSDYE
jgi:hypothetical protein